MLESFDILGVKINTVNLSSASDVISDWIERKVKSYVCIAPVSTIVDCQKDSVYKKIINSASMTTPDGMPVVWLGQWQGYRQVRRTYGPDLMRMFCGLSQEKGYKHFFYGGTDRTNALLKKVLVSDYPQLNIAGFYAPPMRAVGVMEEDTVLAKINESKADILWVGLGSPKQDYWMDQHRDKINVPVIVGVGAAFDFLAGNKKQAPLWMQRSGLEWFFRLCCEPKRLWRRYLIGNSLFLLLLIRNFLGLNKVNKL